MHKLISNFVPPTPFSAQTCAIPPKFQTESVEEPIDDEPAEEKEKPADEDGAVEEEKTEDKPKTKKVEKTIWDWEKVNDVKPIWMRKLSDVTDDEYNEFYKMITKDYEDPMSHVRIFLKKIFLQNLKKNFFKFF